MHLSLCIATFNEEKFIHYPLDSAYDFVDEVIIVDGGSKDRTVEIARQYGKKVKIYHEDNPPMFHINKQKAIERASGDWILQLDADEALSDELKKEIRAIINNKSQAPNSKQISNSNLKNSKLFDAWNLKFGASQPVGYWLPRKNFFLTRFLMKGGVYPDYTIRLYKRGVARFPCKSVHENVEVKGKIGYLKNPILHYADPEFSRYLKRWHRYTLLDAKLLREKGERPGLFSYIFLKPASWFFNAYIRHQGFRDGFPGFVFAFFSSIRFWVIYTKYMKLKAQN